MKIIRRRKCPYCYNKFKPHARLRQRQVTCGEKECRRKHHTKYRRKYRRLNPEAEIEYQRKCRENRPKEFWRDYRRRKRRLTERNRAQSLLRRSLDAEGLQRQIDILQLIEIPYILGQFIEFATSNRLLLLRCVGRRMT